MRSDEISTVNPYTRGGASLLRVLRESAVLSTWLTLMCLLYGVAASAALLQLCCVLSHLRLPHAHALASRGTKCSHDVVPAYTAWC